MVAGSGEEVFDQYFNLGPEACLGDGVVLGDAKQRVRWVMRVYGAI